VTESPGTPASPHPASSADRRARLALLAAIVLAATGMSYETPLVVKITQWYGISDADFGWIQGLGTLVVAVIGLFWGYGADRRPRLRLILMAELLILLSMLLSAACLHFHLPYAFFAAVRIGAGLGLGGIGPIATSAVMDTVKYEQRGAAFGWVGVAWVAGGVVGMLAPAVCLRMGLTLGAIYLVGAVIALGFISALIFVKEPRRGAYDHALRDTVGAGKAEYQYRISRSDLVTLLSRPFNLLLIPAMIFLQFPAQVLIIWFITFLIRNHGISEAPATALLFLSFAGQPFGNAFGGAWTDRAFARKPSGRLTVMIALTAAAPILLAAAMLIPFHWLVFAPLMILANFFMVASGPGLTTAALELNLPEHRGTISALLNVWSNLARGAAWLLPPIIAAAAGGRYERAFLVTAVAYLPLILTYVFMARRIEPDLARLHAILEQRAKEMSQASIP
jgi:MFS family permease